MRVLGAVLAGGASRRFGSDKALATIDGVPLIARTIAALRPQVDALVVVGRRFETEAAIADYPARGLGPLGGLAAALRHAAAAGFDAVLSVPCDIAALPADLAERLAPGDGGARYAQAMPVIGWWPVALADRLAAFVETDPRRSMRGWAAAADARAVALPPIANINTPEDLAAISAAVRAPATPAAPAPR